MFNNFKRDSTAFFLSLSHIGHISGYETCIFMTLSFRWVQIGIFVYCVVFFLSKVREVQTAAKSLFFYLTVYRLIKSRQSRGVILLFKNRKTKESIWKPIIYLKRKMEDSNGVDINTAGWEFMKWQIFYLQFFHFSFNIFQKISWSKFSSFPWLSIDTKFISKE